MRSRLLATGLVACLAVLGGSPTTAQDGGTKDEPKGEPMPPAAQGVHDFDAICSMAALGRRQKSPEALAAAALMLSRLPVQQSRETPDGTPFSFERDVKKLLADARELRPDDDLTARLIARVEDQLKEAARGAVNRSSAHSYGIDSLAKKQHYDSGKWFVNDCLVRVKVEPIKRYPVSADSRALVEILDDKNKVVERGTCFAHRPGGFILTWSAGRTQRKYTIRVTNTGDTTLDVTVVHN